MTTDYGGIRAENERRYGTDIERIVRTLLVERYDDRAHFIFELLQNAEDALARRIEWNGQRSVRFLLGQDRLTVHHFGKPFDERDVRGICGVADSTKDLTAIGRFGIGFKSVYAFTERPEIHSGNEAFAIEGFVRPHPVAPLDRHDHETVIVIPFSGEREAARAEITLGLQQLGPRTLLFLHEIQELEWAVHGGPSGLYLRGEPVDLGDGVRHVTVIGQEEGTREVEETWLVFAKEVSTPAGLAVGHVELAFLVSEGEAEAAWGVRPLVRSPLVVYFPTILETHLGFLVQGPYRTTPSRDNVPRHDDWNQHLVQETATLLVEALGWLRDQGWLDTEALRSLPLNRGKFGPLSMFEPLFERTKRALSTEALLPRFDRGHAAAGEVRLARIQDLRLLFQPEQLGVLLGADKGVAWLSGEISQDRTPELRDYIMRELEVPEITPDLIVSKIDAPFLEAQTDEWIVALYEFLNERPALRPRAAKLPLVRLTDGSHVRPRVDGRPRAFLPGRIKSDFPTVRGSVCSTEASLAFLRSIGLDEPDAVDDVVQNVLPKYRPDGADVGDDEYEEDLKRIRRAFATDSQEQREKLLSALRQSRFVAAVHAKDRTRRLARPEELYLATDRLRVLFEGVRDVWLVDSQIPALRGESVRELLEGSGAVRYLRPVRDDSLRPEELRELRRQSGYEHTSGQNDRVQDWMLLGLPELLASFPEFDMDERREKARLLWEELSNLEDRRGKGVFTGEYTWTHYGNRRAPPFDSAFVRLLNATEWIPDVDGTLRRPAAIFFDSLGWKEDPFLLSKVRFKPPVIEELAREAGIEIGVLELLREHGVTSVAELVTRLGLEEDDDGAGADLPDPGPADGTIGGGSEGGGGTPGTRGRSPGDRTDEPRRTGQRGRPGTRSPGSAGGRPFISYIGSHPDDDSPDPDGLDNDARMALEAEALEFILSREADWERMPSGNPGFDLVKRGADGLPEAYCEVKAMTAGLGDRPVSLSRTQFDVARQARSAYWLYVVEHAGEPDNARLLRIQDPVGRARYFTFDEGWIDVAEPEDRADV